MSEASGDAVLGLLADIAECVATLTARVEAIEVSNASHQAQVNEALATIAEIATRTYYVSKPSSALPDDVINSGVMDAMIERWPRGAAIGMSSHDRQVLSELDQRPDAVIDKLIARAETSADASNAGRIRMGTLLAILNKEKERRIQEGLKRDALGPRR